MAPTNEVFTVRMPFIARVIYIVEEKFIPLNTKIALQVLNFAPLILQYENSGRL